MRYDRRALMSRIYADSTALGTKVHNTGHWSKVALMGRKLAEAEGQDPTFCEVFGFLHDCQRLEDGHDAGHGARAAQYARSIKKLIPFRGKKFKDLLYALKWHDDKTHAPNLQIGCCWDADRLDLRRVGVKPDPSMLNTLAAKTIARRM
jgi:uncharacterized protein